MTDEELLGYLRRSSVGYTHPLRLAADRIEALVKERDRFEAALGRACLVGGTTYLVEKAQKAEARAERLEAALQFYSCKDGCNDCSENERDLIGCGWTARAALSATTEEGK